MQEVLVVIDMQNDFIDGVLGTKEAQAIVPYVIEKVKNFTGPVLFTRDTHEEHYLETQEGKFLPVPHCLRHTPGWEIQEDLEALRKTKPIDKVTFASKELPVRLQELDAREPIRKITFVGLDTDICVISNALIAKAFFPEVEIAVDAKGCAGVTPESHARALAALKPCQVVIEHEPEVIRD